MKKIISLIIALLLCVGLLGTVAFAEEEEKSDVIRFASGATNPKPSDNHLFALEAAYSNGDGWYGGGGYTLTINAQKGLIITRIEAEISNHYDYYSEVGVSGDAVKENYPEKNGDTVTVSNINSSKFSFTGGSNYTQFKNVTVYYRCAHSIVENGICKRCHYVDESTHEHIFDDNNVCACGKTKCDVGEHVLENGFCKFCDFFDETEHEHIFDDSNKCACGIKGCDIEEHVLENGLCKFCEYIDESKHEHIFDDDNNCACGKTKCDVDGHSYKYYCEFCGEEAPENLPAETTGLGSTLSQGNMTIVCSIATLALGLVGGLLIGRKKKPAAANGANREDEE